MTFFDAVKEMLKGKVVVRDKTAYRIDQLTDRMEMLVNPNLEARAGLDWDDAENPFFNVTDILADDWEVVRK